jgi:hypothetical protein
MGAIFLPRFLLLTSEAAMHEYEDGRLRLRKSASANHISFIAHTSNDSLPPFAAEKRDNVLSWEDVARQNPLLLEIKAKFLPGSYGNNRRGGGVIVVQARTASGNRSTG